MATLCSVPADAREWLTESSTSALTDAASFTATLESAEPLRNMIGRPENATLVLRCRDGQIATYVSWPEVVSDNHLSAYESKTLVLTRIDGGKIEGSWWDRSSDGAAAGAFQTKRALKILSAIENATRLVVRMTGLATQDAVFVLDGVDDHARKVRETCGVGVTAASRPPQFQLGRPVHISTALTGQVLEMRVRRTLEAEGFRLDPADRSGNEIVSQPKPMQLTTAQADCGKSFGIAYLADKRAETQVVTRVSEASGGVELRVGIAGLYKVEPEPKVLYCSSTGVLEETLATKLRAALAG